MFPLQGTHTDFKLLSQCLGFSCFLECCPEPVGADWDVHVFLHLSANTVNHSCELWFSPVIYCCHWQFVQGSLKHQKLIDCHANKKLQNELQLCKANFWVKSKLRWHRRTARKKYQTKIYGRQELKLCETRLLLLWPSNQCICHKDKFEL